MSNNISAETLFHFMDEFRFLEATLAGDFSPRYCREQDLFTFFNKPVYVAMKCFCDIPLSLVKKHSEFYGKYAIGFTKDWGLKSSLNPITYYNKDSKFVNHIREAYNSNIKLINEIHDDDPKITELGFTMRSMWNMFLNFKPVSGVMYRRDEIVEKYFYDEREWRYISEVSTGLEMTDEGDYIELRPYYQSEDIEILKYNINNCSTQLSKKVKIDFELSDINFIIVTNDSEVDKVCTIIDSLSSDFTTKNRLKTKIIKYSDIEKNV